MWGVLHCCAGRIIRQALDMVTICVPPSLPVCLSAAVGIALTRLRKHDIFVSEPNKLVAAGHLDIACFDKTGTLTESGLDLLGVLPVVGAAGRRLFASTIEQPSLFPQDVEQLLASCHSLATVDGNLVRFVSLTHCLSGYFLPWRFEATLGEAAYHSRSCARNKVEQNGEKRMEGRQPAVPD